VIHQALLRLSNSVLLLVGQGRSRRGRRCRHRGCDSAISFEGVADWVNAKSPAASDLMSITDQLRQMGMN
jgi:hypothetical protein